VSALLIVIVTFAGYLIAYHTYGRFLAKKIFRLDDSRQVPSHLLSDGIDYVPTRKGIIFGHHYTSIAGTGPIVGPAIGIIWGWVPALIWVFVGSIVMGAVHDFGALVVSMRNRGESISQITARYVNGRARLLFFGIAFLELLIVIAVFGVVIGVVFKRFPQSVFPVWCEIPIAILTGLAVYKWKQNVALATVVAVTIMYVTVYMGHLPGFQFDMKDFLAARNLASVPPTAVWVVILLIYAYVASTIPVTVLLQPRDYINAWQLFVAMGLLIVAVFGATFRGGLEIVAPAFQAAPQGAPPIWPFLFITIACGAISGFHSLVASGTTPKQIRRESDSLFVAYGSMLMEGALAVLVIVAVAAGIGYDVGGEGAGGAAAWTAHYKSWAAAGGLEAKIAAVVNGSGNMMASLGIPNELGIVIMGVFIASFAGTTLDTATRIQRYVISELGASAKAGFLKNRWLATAVAVGTAGGLAFATGADGMGAMKLWPMFGAVNQLLAALALLLVTIYLKREHRWGWLLTLAPCVFMLAMTIWAMVVNEQDYLKPLLDQNPLTNPSWVLVIINALTLALAAWLVVEAFVVFFKPRAEAAEEEVAAEAVTPAGEVAKAE